MSTSRGKLLKRQKRQVINDAVYRATQLLHEWDNRFQLGATDLLERYRAFHLRLHLHFKIGVYGHGKQFCAMFQGLHAGAVKDRRSLDPASFTEMESPCPKNSDGDHSVLVGVVQILKYPKGMLVYGTRSLVGLHPLDICAGEPGNVLYHGTSSGFVSCSGLENRKLSLMFRGSTVSLEAQGVNGMVKGRPQLMGRFTGKQHDIKRWLEWARRFRDNVDPATIGIFLNSRYIGVSLTEGDNISIELLEVLSGPFDLCAGSIQEGRQNDRHSKDSHGKGNPNSEAQRLLQESEESRYALTETPPEEVTARTVPSHPRGGCTATRTHSGSPADAS